MVETGAARSRIYDYLLRNGENVVRRDIDNLVSRGTSRVTTEEDDEKTAGVLIRFRSADKANVVTIDETDKGESGVISLSSRLMRESFARFPEMLMVDCTHKTNRYVRRAGDHVWHAHSQCFVQIQVPTLYVHGNGRKWERSGRSAQFAGNER
jgi:hypothetical protein